MTTQSQRKQILKHLMKGNEMTAIDALTKFRCMRLAARINELREMGHNVKTDMVTENGKRFAKYSLI